MIGCSFVANRDYFGQLGLLDSGMDVYGGENIELGIRVCVTQFRLVSAPSQPFKFKWSSGHRSVALLINMAPLRALENCSSVHLTGGWRKLIGHTEQEGYTGWFSLTTLVINYTTHHVQCVCHFFSFSFFFFYDSTLISVLKLISLFF